MPADEVPDGSDVVVRVTLDLCGDLPPVELHGSTWDVGRRLSERCFGRVEVSDIRSEETLEVERRAFFSGNCSRPMARPTASTRDARQLTHAWQRHQDGSHTYFVSGPGGADDTRRDGGRDFVIE